MLDTHHKIEETLFHMANDGQIKAKINCEQQTIAFIDAASIGSKEEQDKAREGEYFEVISELEKQNKRILELMKLMEQVNTNIKRSPEHIKRSMFSDVRLVIVYNSCIEVCSEGSGGKWKRRFLS
jgi:hypothetical protein